MGVNAGVKNLWLPTGWTENLGMQPRLCMHCWGHMGTTYRQKSMDEQLKADYCSLLECWSWIPQRCNPSLVMKRNLTRAGIQDGLSPPKHVKLAVVTYVVFTVRLPSGNSRQRCKCIITSSSRELLSLSAMTYDKTSWTICHNQLESTAPNHHQPEPTITNHDQPHLASRYYKYCNISQTSITNHDQPHSIRINHQQPSSTTVLPGHQCQIEHFATRVGLAALGISDIGHGGDDDQQSTAVPW